MDSSLHIGVRLERELVERVDAYAAKLSASLHGLHVSRSDALRVLIRKGLEMDGVEREREAA